MHGVSKKAMADVIQEFWRDRDFRDGEEGASKTSCVEMLTAHDAETIYNGEIFD